MEKGTNYGKGMEKGTYGVNIRHDAGKQLEPPTCKKVEFAPLIIFAVMPLILNLSSFSEF